MLKEELGGVEAEAHFEPTIDPPVGVVPTLTHITGPHTFLRWLSPGQPIASATVFLQDEDILATLGTILPPLDRLEELTTFNNHWNGDMLGTILSSGAFQHQKFIDSR
ncbi:hypothetical protein FRC03_011274 [Tulasnella sp. 419]|nr:hypothetical protein FRC02_005559 [Tulasnella sp. 418]KAG8955239.1 hypothetical protein FRC03_011274 [Tulasnella sp. 419]